MALLLFFFFSSRRRHTRCGRDWSSDVCSSDLSGSGRRILTVHEATANVNTVEFNSSGTLLLTADVPGSASVWDANTGQLLSRYAQGASPVDRAQFSADGNRIITGSLKRAMIWDTRSDTRDPSGISAYIRCRVPFKL